MWHKIFFNSQSIKNETNSSVLIKMPNNSEYNGCFFWHPKKLVREQGGKGYHYTFSFEDGWIFNVKKYGAGKHNALSVIRENELSANDMKRVWGVVDKTVNDFVEYETDKINSKIALSEEIEITIEHHIPEKKEPISNLEIHKNLLR